MYHSVASTTAANQVCTILPAWRSRVGVLYSSRYQCSRFNVNCTTEINQHTSWCKLKHVTKTASVMPSSSAAAHSSTLHADPVGYALSSSLCAKVSMIHTRRCLHQPQTVSIQIISTLIFLLHHSWKSSIHHRTNLHGQRSPSTIPNICTVTRRGFSCKCTQTAAQKYDL